MGESITILDDIQMPQKRRLRVSPDPALRFEKHAYLVKMLSAASAAHRGSLEARFTFSRQCFSLCATRATPDPRFAVPARWSLQPIVSRLPRAACSGCTSAPCVLMRLSFAPLANVIMSLLRFSWILTL